MSQTTETPQPTNAELVAQVVGAVTAVQDAEAVLVEGAKNLADHIADPNAHGRDVAACIAQAVADHDGNEGAHNGTFVKAGDARLTDARAPKPHKDSHKTGGADALAPADIGAAPPRIPAWRPQPPCWAMSSWARWRERPVKGTTPA